MGDFNVSNMAARTIDQATARQCYAQIPLRSLF